MPFPKLVKPVVARRDEFLDVAQRLFASGGYDATSVNQIVAELGVSKGAFYHHFEAKEDLIEALARRYAGQMAVAAQAIIDDSTLDAYARLSRFLDSMRRRKLDSAAEMRTTFEPLFRAENIQLYERTQRAVTEVLRPILTCIIAEGVIERTFDTTDPESAAEVIMHLMSSNRDLITALYTARDAAEFDVLGRKLLKKVTYLGTVIDRLLGLPEGSLQLVDDQALKTLACALDGTPSCGMRAALWLPLALEPAAT